MTALVHHSTGPEQRPIPLYMPVVRRGGEAEGRLLRQLDTIETYDTDSLDPFLLNTSERKEWSTKVAEVLGQGDTRQEKVALAMRQCGSIWLRNTHENGGKRYQTMYCGRRWCPICGNAKSKKKAAILMPVVYPLAAAGKVSLVTVTLKNSNMVELDRLWESWRKLTRSARWRRTYEGAIANIELTVSRSGQMHWHLHALVVGDYLDKRQLSAMWKAITGDSFIVDIRQVRDLGKGLFKAVFEVCKYIAKGAHLLRLGVEGFLGLDAATRGRRFTSRQGIFRGLPDVPETLDEGDEGEGGAEVKAKGRIVRTEVLIHRGRGFDIIDAGTPDEIARRLEKRGMGRLAQMLLTSRDKAEREPGGENEPSDLFTGVH